jgi:hypothetical protein
MNAFLNRSAIMLVTSLIFIVAATPSLAANANATAYEQCNPATLRNISEVAQVPDMEFKPKVTAPAYPAGKGPKVLVDEGHINMHTIDGRYAPFAALLRRDGYVVEPHKGAFTEKSLAAARVLVIANALAEKNKTVEGWNLPAGSAFTPDDIRALHQWVSEGGSLMLIADHMPMPGPATDLARAFGIVWMDGFSANATCSDIVFAFSRQDGTLGDHVITQGRSASERIDKVVAFDGSAFYVPGGAAPLMVLPPKSIVLLPEKAWAFTQSTPRIPADGMLLGAALSVGKGRVTAFAEASMFSAQVQGPEKRQMGMNSPSAPQNPQFLLNTMHWLSGLLPQK